MPAHTTWYHLVHVPHCIQYLFGSFSFKESSSGSEHFAQLFLFLIAASIDSVLLNLILLPERRGDGEGTTTCPSSLACSSIALLPLLCRREDETEAAGEGGKILAE